MDTPTITQYQFEFNQLHFIIEFKNTKLPNEEVASTVVFYEIDDKGNATYEQTNKHKYTFALFATLTRIIKDTIPYWNVLVFASDENRVGLYTLLTKRFSKGMKLYHFSSKVGRLWLICKQPIPQEELDTIKDQAEQFILSKQQ